MDPRKQKFKIWRADKNSIPAFQCTPRSVIMSGNKNNSIICDENAIYISQGGSVSFGTTSENIRYGGLFVGMNDFIKMIPQTIMTPFPSLIPFLPLALMFSSAKEILVAAAIFSPR